MNRAHFIASFWTYIDGRKNLVLRFVPKSRNMTKANVHCNIWCYSAILLVSSQSVFSCNFDNIVSSSIATGFVNYNSKNKRDMNKVNVHSEFKPLRIHIYYGIMDHGIISDQITRLFTIMEKAKSRMSQLLAVKPVSGPLFLPRTKACDRYWGPHSRNRDKCASIHQGYVGEFCENKIDYFQIPESHLAGLNVYNFSDNRPLKSSLPSGSGVQNADYILYVNAQNTYLCQTQDVAAYASYCVLDQNDRPIAGFINFCPLHLKEKKDERKILMVAVHELFHALGFSKDMFNKFKDCSDSESSSCAHWKRTVIQDKHNINRLSLPTVIEKMQDHFKCSDLDFGAPLNIKNSEDIGSHWHPVMMHGSIMSPDIGNAHVTSIDPISAAVFADSGWYQVNFSSTDQYFWGKGAGCEFAVSEQCDAKHSTFFCNINDNTRKKGCDYLQMAQSSCQKVGQWEKCGIYKSNTTDHCHEDLSSSRNLTACFMLNNSYRTESVCAIYQCFDNHIKVLIDSMWMYCLSGTKVTFEYQEERFSLICPNWKVLCALERKHTFYASRNTVEVNIFFSRESIEQALKKGTLEEMHLVALQNLKLKSNVDITPASSRIYQMEDYYILSVHVALSEDVDISKATSKSLKAFVMTGSFSFPFKSDADVSAIGLRINESEQEKNGSVEEYLLFIILAVTVIMIMAVVAIVLGYFRYKKWKPPSN